MTQTREKLKKLLGQPGVVAESGKTRKKGKVEEFKWKNVIEVEYLLESGAREKRWVTRRTHAIKKKPETTKLRGKGEPILPGTY